MALPVFALLHASWHGFTPTDLVFPSFLFAVGNAMSFVMLKWDNNPHSEVFWKILKRTIYHFLIGLPDVLVSIFCHRQRS